MYKTKRMGQILMTPEAFAQVLALPQDVDVRVVETQVYANQICIVLQGAEWLPETPEGTMPKVIDWQEIPGKEDPLKRWNSMFEEEVKG